MCMLIFHKETLSDAILGTQLCFTFLNFLLRKPLAEISVISPLMFVEDHWGVTWCRLCTQAQQNHRTAWRNALKVAGR